MKKIILILLVIISSEYVFSQNNVGIGITTPNASAILDLTATDMGLLVPRVALTQTSSNLPITAPATSLLVYNTTTVNDVTPGYYYWDGSQWVRFVSGSASNAWTLLGNGGTNPATNFLGTTDNQELSIRTNNTEYFRITTIGQIVPINTGRSLFIGENAGANDDGSDNRNIFIGPDAGTNCNTGSNNIAMGRLAFSNSTTGYYNITLGEASMWQASIDCRANVSIGHNAMSGTVAYSNTSYNVAVGAYSLRLINGGDYNIGVGYQAGNSITTGNNNTIIGYDADVTAGTYTNATAIGYGAIATSSNQMRLGNSSITSLYCQGAYAATSVNPPNLYVSATGQIMRSTAASGPGDDWHILGNAGTTTGTNFLGTTDAQDLDIRTNNIIHVRITQKGQIETVNTGHSVFIGENAGENDNFSDNENVFIGYNAGLSNTSGEHGIGIGCNALYSNTIGYQNIGIGEGALYSTTDGDFNIASGYHAMYNNTGGRYNVAIGHEVMENNISADFNIAQGFQAMHDLTTGVYNIAIGSEAMENGQTGNDNNVAIGWRAMQGVSYTESDDNIAIGYYSLNNINGGDNNIALGYRSLVLNSTGHHNVASGQYSLSSNTTGSYNVASGQFSLYRNTTANFNTANGTMSLEENTTGVFNTGNGAYSLEENTTGNYNTASGYSAFSVGTFSNSGGFGYDAEPGASNTIRLGNNAVSTIGGYANWTNVSDKRFKTNVQENVVGIDFIMKLRPITYNLDMNAIAEFNNTPDSLRLFESEKLKGTEIQSGFIAQEVEQAANELGYDFSGVDKPKNETSHYGLRYAEFVVPLVKATQEQQATIEFLEEQNKQLLKTVEELQEQNKIILERLNNIENK